MRTTYLIEALEQTAERRGEMVRELYRSAGHESGDQILGKSGVIQTPRRDSRSPDQIYRCLHRLAAILNTH